MQLIKFITIEDKEITCWCETNTLKMFRDFMQYILDNLDNPEKFMLWDVEKDIVYDAYKIATEQFQMRKRTFYERMNNVQTGKWAGVEL